MNPWLAFALGFFTLPVFIFVWALVLGRRCDEAVRPVSYMAPPLDFAKIQREERLP